MLLLGCTLVCVFQSGCTILHSMKILTHLHFSLHLSDYSYISFVYNVQVFSCVTSFGSVVRGGNSGLFFFLIAKVPYLSHCFQDFSFFFFLSLKSFQKFQYNVSCEFGGFGCFSFLIWRLLSVLICRLTS